MEGLFWPSMGKWGTTEAVQTGTWEDLEAVRWRDWRSIKNCKQRELAEKMAGTSLVVQRIRIHLWMQVTRVQSLVREDFTCHGATRPLHRNYWAQALEVRSYGYGNPQPWSLCSPTREAAAMCTTTREQPPLATIEGLQKTRKIQRYIQTIQKERMAAPQVSEEEALTEGAVEIEVLDWRAAQESELRNATSYLLCCYWKISEDQGHRKRTRRP